MTADVENWFSVLTPEQAAIANDLRSMIRSKDDALREELKWGQPCYSRKSMIFYIQKSKKHISLGFGDGTRLMDPSGRLEGAGSQLRHLKFAHGTAPDYAAAAAFIDQAVALDRQGVGEAGQDRRP